MVTVNSLDNLDKELWFKIKHRILLTKDILLYKMNITMNDRCVLCNGERETIEHLFIYCQKTFVSLGLCRKFAQEIYR